MPKTSDLGQIVILNGVPRSGKWSIVASIQATFDGPWMNLGVDTFKEHVTPKRYSLGIGLRLGGERPNLKPLMRGKCPCCLHNILEPALGFPNLIHHILAFAVLQH